MIITAKKPLHRDILEPVGTDEWPRIWKRS
jgi:hypothetical protein